jgi:hypothetical protein
MVNGLMAGPTFFIGSSGSYVKLATQGPGGAIVPYSPSSGGTTTAENSPQGVSGVGAQVNLNQQTQDQIASGTLTSAWQQVSTPDYVGAVSNAAAEVTSAATGQGGQTPQNPGGGFSNTTWLIIGLAALAVLGIAIVVTRK